MRNDYVAYHSAEVMGRPYRPGKHFSFFSKKAEPYLRRALGESVWVIASNTQAPKERRYFLEGVYVPATVVPDNDSWVISGEGIAFRPDIDVTEQQWFIELRREQRNFRLGFNRIRSPSVLRALDGYRSHAQVDPTVWSVDETVQGFVEGFLDPAPAATSNSSTRDQVKLPHLTAAG